MSVVDFDEFYVENYANVVGSLRLAVSDRSEAEDAAQEAFAKALLKWPKVSKMARPAACDTDVWVG